MSRPSWAIEEMMQAHPDMSREEIIRTSGGSVNVGGVRFGNDLPLSVIAGPCVMESRGHAIEMAYGLGEIARKVGIGLVFKSSFDKANRTSGKSYRGTVGAGDAASIFADIRELGMPVITDVHEAWQCERLGESVDALQIPAFLCRQTDLLRAAGLTGCAINIKKGQFLAPWDVAHCVEKVRAVGNSNVIVTERGASFGYNNLVVDMRSLHIMAGLTGCPVIFDATHSVQQPGGMGDRSGGQREFVPVLARSAVAAGVSGVFIETHQDPDSAPSDGPNMVPLKEMEQMLRELVAIDALVKHAD